MEICGWVSKSKLTLPLHSIEVLFSPRRCLGRLEFQDFNDTIDWNAVSNVAVTTNDRVRFEQRVDD